MPGTLSSSPLQAGPVPYQASLVSCHLVSLTRPPCPTLSSRSSPHDLSAGFLLPGTHFLIDLSEPSASGNSSSQALLAAAFSSSPALALLPGLHTPFPGLRRPDSSDLDCLLLRISVRREKYNPPGEEGGHVMWFSWKTRSHMLPESSVQNGPHCIHAKVTSQLSNS